MPIRYQCEQFLMCDNAATRLVPHPILGEVPSCQRCIDKLGLKQGRPLV
jgi:hypothetical protein